MGLHLYDDEWRFFLGPNNIPLYVDFAASEFHIRKVAAQLVYLPEQRKHGALCN